MEENLQSFGVHAGASKEMMTNRVGLVKFFRENSTKEMVVFSMAFNTNYVQDSEFSDA
ncbi:hypothetical protein [Leptospira mayottensis]|uniref:Uncharacterized protein n=1 Tax=Leptospira mayottensis 200901122 TaxID=1193010 RepID=A0AA87MPJ9_9LEPT|nr:hypothetical protein [Leptospira mayottensis]EKS00987.1 hypothetical protein LEP1GSC125_2032 [Leptospira mayottensis 200901122]